MEHLKKFWASYGALFAGVAYFLIPSVQAYAASHTGSTVATLLAAVLVAFHSTAPKDAFRSQTSQSVNPGFNKGLAMFLCFSMLAFGPLGCSLAWVGTLDTILAAAAPALNNVITIIALAKNQPVNQALEDKITKDAANLKTLASDFAKASGTNPTTCQEVQAGVAVFNDDAAVVLQLVQASGSSNIAAIFQAADAFVVIIVGLIPSCASPSALKAGIPARVAKVDVNAMVDHYNEVLTTKSGNAAVDAYAKANRVHAHSSIARILSFGTQK
jgi:hypothetical protein